MFFINHCTPHTLYVPTRLRDPHHPPKMYTSKRLSFPPKIFRTQSNLAKAPLMQCTDNPPTPPAHPLVIHTFKQKNNSSLQQQRSRSNKCHDTHHAPSAQLASRARERRHSRARRTRSAGAGRTAPRRRCSTARGTVTCREQRRRTASNAHAARARERGSSLDGGITTGSCAGPRSCRCAGAGAGGVSRLLRAHGYRDEGLGDGGRGGATGGGCVLEGGGVGDGFGGGLQGCC